VKQVQIIVVDIDTGVCVVFVWKTIDPTRYKMHVKNVMNIVASLNQCHS